MSSVFLDLVSALIFLILGALANRIYSQVRGRRPGQRIWRLRRGARVTIVTAAAPFHDDEEFTITVYPAEYSAATEVASYLSHSLGCKIDRVCNSDEHPLDHSLENNLVLIGGPNHNRLSKLFLARLNIDFAFDYCDLIHKTTKTTYAPLIEDDAITQDYGLIILTSNPFNPAARLIMLLGCRTYGCVAASRILIQERTALTAKLLSDWENAVLVVQTDVVGQYAGRISVCYAQEKAVSALAA